MKILHLSTHDNFGGAARATNRIHKALELVGIESKMRVVNKFTSDKNVSNWYSKTILKKIRYELYQRWLIKVKRIWHHENKEMHSFGTYGIGIIDEVNSSDADVVHLHWISDMLSIEDIGKIRKPIVWTMHDMWAFCGAEHYALEDEKLRFVNGYLQDNRANTETGPDFNRKTWMLKKKNWSKQNFSIVSTSKWLYHCAKESVLFYKSNHYLVPYPLDSNTIWYPINKKIARTVLNLPQDSHLILMGADGGIGNPRKGGDLLKEAIIYLDRFSNLPVELIIFGQSNPDNPSEWPKNVHWLGAVTDDRVLALAYSASDVMVVPSRQEAFGQTASESLACGTPVVAFDIGGLSDIVLHKENGWLSKPFDTRDMAQGIQWILEDSQRHHKLAIKARESVIDRYDPTKIALMYKEVYESALQYYNKS
jgi:glycosyltransferase involved in cell wall biosynthesis